MQYSGDFVDVTFFRSSGFVLIKPKYDANERKSEAADRFDEANETFSITFFRDNDNVLFKRGPLSEVISSGGEEDEKSEISVGTKKQEAAVETQARIATEGLFEPKATSLFGLSAKTPQFSFLSSYSKTN